MRVRTFVEDVIKPAIEPFGHREEMSGDGYRDYVTALITLRKRAVSEGLWLPHMPVEWGGMGLGHVALAMVQAVDDVSFDIRRGECLGLVGESGCGKTTVSKIIMRAVTPDEGEIVFDDGKERVDITALEGEALRDGRVLLQAGPGTPDGFRVDVDGNLWCGWGMGDPDLDGVRVFNPAGAPIGHIALPERCANLCFGGLKRNRLFMAASQSVYALYVNTQGALGG